MQYISLRNLRFILHEVLDLEAIRRGDRFGDFDREAIDFSLDAAGQLADQYLHPVYTRMDRDKAYFADGKVHVLPEVGEGLRAMGGSGWLSAAWDEAYEGQRMPLTVLNAGTLVFQSANGNLAAYGLLTKGAANLILEFGTQELKDTYLAKMAAGDWQGTMALTEPQAGSSLSDITSYYEEQEDGSYHIYGQKIYISGGDHTEAENVIHLMLARKKDGPKGVKGVSLFVVPKYLPGPDGGLIDNHVTTAGIYGKMGQKGYVAAHLMFGEQGTTRGFLVGEELRGLNHMFLMMNEARIGTGIMATGAASAAYYASLKYARERSQGRHPGNKDVNAPQVPIIEHADVRRMLLFQKAVVEGSIALLLQCSLYQDLHTARGDDRSHLLLELLTPIAKSFPSEYGNESVSLAMQVMGGAGYTDDHPVEQLFRDIRVNSIYEGTTTIHGLDLLGRKVMMENGKAVVYLAEEIQSEITGATGQTAALGAALGKGLEEMQQVLQHLMQLARKEDPRVFLADATIFLEYFGLHVIGWMWLRQANAAERTLDAGENQAEQNFYRSKLQTARYFFSYVFTRTAGLRRTLLAANRITLDTDPELLM
ncbi:butyryl-CoA dehydrogenase [Lewinella marina]|uniref:Acyl-CoA dehydrogenase n=1 Tax=Neolewinella marina TaxID=438751 RepID=A0A2G0CFQ7_9BACT|nr:acyl-CoA dehydrogenase [Neolewinella marina]NJB85498.1 butyryl-CoA dehydrogenase [Neolewinella marina]PHK98813.1 acyl-CoA dehydrogenase [Neolewinella marina]